MFALRRGVLVGVLRRGLATTSRAAPPRPLEPSELALITKSFHLFDLNGDSKITLHEVERAYLHKSAGSQVVRLLEESGSLGGKGVRTWELLEDFDLLRAWKQGEVQTVGDPPVVLELQFKNWMTGVLEAHAKRADALEGAQDMME